MHPMSIIIKFFSAPDDAAAAAVVDLGPDGVFESLYSGNFDAEEALIEWESILTDRDFEELVAAEEPGVVADGEGPMVLVASRTLQNMLAAADPPRLAELSESWVRLRAADGEAFDEEMAAGLLDDLARLARSVDGREDRLYCWLA